MSTPMGVAELYPSNRELLEMANFFKKKGGGQVATSGIQMTDSEAALAQSDFNIEKITEIQNRFTGGMVLLYPGRIFIREGLLWKMCRKGPKKRHFFLFNDILVYGSVVANRYSNQHILPLSQMSVSAECFYQPRVNADFDEDSEQMELDGGNAFQISHADKSFHVFSLSSADKANWLANLHKHINKVAQSVSNDKQIITKPVWVPDSMSKECMVCSIKFTAFIRKHHCRHCGRVICSACSPHRIASNPQSQSSQVDSKKMERVCTDCFKDISTVQSRSGFQVQRPPPPAVAAAKLVSSVLTTNTSQSLKSTQEKDHDSSTDTEDSDDSENEQQKEEPATLETDADPTMSIPESDPQPTPPPRKKKLKKKLEQIVEKQLDQNLMVGNSEADNMEDLEADKQPKLNEVQVIENTESGAAETAQTSTEEAGITDQGKSPKKSRRKKKHNTAQEETESTADDKVVKTDWENCEEVNDNKTDRVKEDDDNNKTDREKEDDPERHLSQSVDTNVKKTRTRKKKFK